MKRIKRTRDFEINLILKNEDFIRPPHDGQRNWLLNQAVGEFTQNLEALDGLARRFVPGEQHLASGDRTQAALNDQEIMEDWQLPLMEKMAEVATENHGDILEIGFGRGISSAAIQRHGVKSHTIIECNDTIVERFHEWRATLPDHDIRLVHGLWQDTLGDLGLFDSVFFHTYPLNEDDLVEQIGSSVTFAEHFFAHAAAHLKPGGIFTYLSNEMDSFGRTHQRLLFSHFSKIELQVVSDLVLPTDVKDAWWADSMVVVKATR